MIFPDFGMFSLPRQFFFETEFKGGINTDAMNLIVLFEPNGLPEGGA
jgi:hypothetical protein